MLAADAERISFSVGVHTTYRVITTYVQCTMYILHVLCTPYEPERVLCAYYVICKWTFTSYYHTIIPARLAARARDWPTFALPTPWTWRDRQQLAVSR